MTTDTDTRRTRRTARTGRTARRRRRLIAVALVALLAAGFYLVPRRSQSVVTVDGKTRWADATAPPRRQVIWRQAEAVAPIAADRRGADSHIRPQLAENGAVLYFTIRTENDQYEIYRSRRAEGQWTEAEPVAELNSEAHDIGPVIRADGKVLYLYSDRDGGLGGMDLYMSTRQDDGWSRPQNMGPTINSPAHEFDPAVSPDGQRLLFASNRSERLHRMMVKGNFDPAADHWQTTLRTDLGNRKFDLYAVRRDDDKWQAAAPLTELNEPNSNEGSPYISPDGVFLYFVSDRPARQGEPENYDVYRTRVDGNRPLAENLGPGVNTAANEIEPSLSAEGFRIIFSRNSESDDASSQYTLFESTAAEVEVVTEWDASSWHAFVGGLGLVFTSPWLIAALLLAALVASLIWLLRRVSLRRATVPGFLLLALLLHLVIITGSFYTYFGQRIVANLKRAFGEEEVVATHVLSQSHQSHAPGEASYEKVADLTAPEARTEVVRQVQEAVNVPLPIESVMPQIPTRMSRPTDLDLVVASAPVQSRPPETSQLARQAVKVVHASAEVELAQTEAMEPKAVTVPEPVEAALSRREVTSPAAPAELPQVIKDSAVPLAADSVPRMSDTAAPAPAVEAAPLKRATVDPVDVASSAQSQIQTEAIEQQQAPAAETAQPIELELAKAAVSPAMPMTASLPRATAPQQQPLELAADLALRPDSDSPAPTAPVRPSPLQRLARSQHTANADAIEVETIRQAIATDAGATTSPTASPAPSLANATPMQVARRKPAAAVAELPPAPAAGSAMVRSPLSGLSRAPLRRAETKTEVAVSANSLSRAARQPPRQLVAESMVVTEKLAGTPSAAAPADSPLVAELEVGVDRAAGQPIQLAVNELTKFGGPSNPSNPQLVIGSLSKDRVDSPVSTSPIASRLSRRPARAPATHYADDNVNLRSLLRRRDVDSKTKAEIVKKYGGSDETLVTVQRGLTWILRHQFRDGHWGLHNFNQTCQGHQKCAGHGGSQSDTAATGLALLPLLGDGNTHQVGPHKDAVARGITWLAKHQQESGDLFTGGEANSRMYSHGIATIALCECYGMSGDPGLRGPAQCGAIDFIVAAQHEPTGGWRYQPNQPADTSVVGWQVMALKSGQMADLNVPEKTLEGAKRWLTSVSGKGGQQGQYGYQGRDFKPAMTAEGMMCMEYLGADRNSPEITRSAEVLLKRLPANGQDNSYYWYYATQALFHLQGEPWRQWNGALDKLLVETQRKEGELAGTWDPKDQWESRGGRIYATSLRLLMLEASYRHLPLYQILE